MYNIFLANYSTIFIDDLIYHLLLWMILGNGKQIILNESRYDVGKELYLTLTNFPLSIFLSDMRMTSRTEEEQ